MAFESTWYQKLCGKKTIAACFKDEKGKNFTQPDSILQTMLKSDKSKYLNLRVKLHFKG